MKRRIQLVKPDRRAITGLLLSGCILTSGGWMVATHGGGAQNPRAFPDSLDLQRFLARRNPVGYTVSARSRDPVRRGEHRYRFESGGAEYVCEVRGYRIAQNNDRLIDPNPALSAMWPGALVRTRGIQRGTLTEIPLPRRPLRIRMFPQSDVSGALVREVRADVVADSITGMRSRNTATSAGVSFLKTEFYSAEQAGTSLGFTAGYGGVTGSGSDELSAIRNENTVVADYQQIYYHVYAEPNAWASQYLAGVDTSDLVALLEPDEPLAYVSDVAYGRRAFIRINGRYTHEQMKSALSFAYSDATGRPDPAVADTNPARADQLAAAATAAGGGGRSGSGALRDSMTQILRTSNIQVQVLGGPDEPAVVLVGAQKLDEFLRSGISAGSSNPGHPISWVVRNIAGGDIIAFGNSANYEVYSCEPYEAVIRVTAERLTVQGDCETLGAGEFFWRFMLDDDVLSESGVENHVSMHGGEGHPIGISGTVRRLARNDNASRIRIRGWVKEDDGFTTGAVDNVGSFDQRYSFAEDRWHTNAGSGAHKGRVSFRLGGGGCQATAHFRFDELGAPTGPRPAAGAATLSALASIRTYDREDRRRVVRENGTIIPGRTSNSHSFPAPPTWPRPQQGVPLDPGHGGRSITSRALLPGDLVILTTASFPSAAVRAATGGGPASHVMLYDGRGHVIEALPGAGVTIRPLQEALAAASFAVAVRVPAATSSARQQTVEAALSRLGARYNYLGALNEARFTFNGVPVHLNLGPGSLGARKFYCSELVLDAFEQAGIILAEKGAASPNDLIPLLWLGNLEYVGHLKTS